MFHSADQSIASNLFSVATQYQLIVTLSPTDRTNLEAFVTTYDTEQYGKHLLGSSKDR